MRKCGVEIILGNWFCCNYTAMWVKKQKKKKAKSKFFRLCIFGWGSAELFSGFFFPLHLAQLARQKLRWYIYFITVVHIVSLKSVYQCLFFLSFLILCIFCHSSWKFCSLSQGTGCHFVERTTMTFCLDGTDILVFLVSWRKWQPDRLDFFLYIISQILTIKALI